MPGMCPPGTGTTAAAAAAVAAAAAAAAAAAITTGPGPYRWRHYKESTTTPVRSLRPGRWRRVGALPLMQPVAPRAMCGPRKGGNKPPRP